MADDTTDTPDGADDAPAKTGEGGSAGKGKLFLILCAAVAFLAAGAGYGVAVLTTGTTPLAPASAQAGEAPVPGEDEPAAAAADEPGAEAETFLYKDLDPITVNLNEPRLARYVHASVTLGIREDEFNDVSPQVDARTNVLRDWLTVYLTSLTLDDVRGPENLNRIRREILDAFNTELWPDATPKIRKVLFKEFAVK